MALACEFGRRCIIKIYALECSLKNHWGHPHVEVEYPMHMGSLAASGCSNRGREVGFFSQEPLIAFWSDFWKGHVLRFFSDLVAVPSVESMLDLLIFWWSCCRAKCGVRAGSFNSLVILFMCQVWSQGWTLRFFNDLVAVPSLESWCRCEDIGYDDLRWGSQMWRRAHAMQMRWYKIWQQIRNQSESLIQICSCDNKSELRQTSWRLVLTLAS